MGEPARKLSHGKMMYPARPRLVRSDLDTTRLTLLLMDGNAMQQPWYRGRRLIYLPDRISYSSPRGLFTPTGIPFVDLPDDVRLEGALPLELILLRSGQLRCVDVMIPYSLEERMLFGQGVTPEPMYHPVRGVDGARQALERALEEGYAGVTFKDRRVRYPWLPFGSRYVDGWWNMQRRTQ